MKILARVLLLVLIPTIWSCCPDFEVATIDFEADDLALLSYDVGNFRSIDGNENIQFSSFVMRFETSASELQTVSVPKRKRSLFRSPDCGTPPPVFSLADDVVSIKVTSPDNFSANFPAGSDLNTLFSTLYVHLNEAEPERGPEILSQVAGVSVIELNQHVPRRGEMVDFRGQEELFFYGLRLTTSPDQTITTRFNVELEFQSGKTLNASTDLITIRP